MPLDPPVPEIDCKALKMRLDAGEPIVVLDCRECDETDFVRIEGARLIPMSALAQRVAELDGLKHAEIVVVCHHGMRSLRVASWLRARGFETVASLAGGIDRWAVDVDPRLPRY